jgi:exopolysaccharide production protein ExoF
MIDYLRRILAIVPVVWILAVPATASSADDYLLGPEDKVRVRVADWQTAEATFRDWPPIEGEYAVGMAGNISLPLIGETPAAGKTTAEIAEAVAEEMQQKFALIERPQASVEIVEYRPFYILGDVQTPGKYPFAPSLTVVKAVSTAGGILRSPDGMRVERDVINARSNYDIATTDRDRLLARKARLLAEANDADKIEAPAELAKHPQLSKLMADEEAIFTANNQRIRLQIEALANLRDLLHKEIASLDKKAISQQRQVDLAKKELAGLGNLAEKGLVVSTRILSIERTISDLESRVLDLGTASLRAKQDIVKADQDEVNLRNDRAAQIASALQAADQDIANESTKAGMYRDLMSEALSFGSEMESMEDSVQVSYEITRGDGKNAEKIAGDENTPLQPGDVIKVVRTLSPSQ